MDNQKAVSIQFETAFLFFCGGVLFYASTSMFFSMVTL
jgi:hypothetical protein